MRVLFVHQNFPGQYKHLAAHLASQAENEIVFLTQRGNEVIPGVKQVLYRAARNASVSTHHYVRSLEAAVLTGQAAYRAALQLKTAGFAPDIMIGHNGWG